MRFAVDDIIGAPVSREEIDYRFDYTDPAGNLDENGRIKAFYGLIFVLSGFLVFIRLYMSIFGRRMRNEGLRWHSIYLSIFNFAQLIFYANTATNSPWYDYMRSIFIMKHSLAIEQVTLVAFPVSIVFLIPSYILTYIFPSFRRSFLFKWFFWVLLYIGLTAVPVYLFLNYMNLLDGSGSLPYNPLVGYYQFIVCYLATFWGFILVFSLFFGYMCLCGYAVTNYNLPDRSVLNRKTKDNNNLFMFAAYCWVVGLFCMPKNVINFTNFYLTNIVPLLQKSVQTYAVSNENPQENMQKFMRYANVFNQILFYVPLTELLFPLVEFVAASIFLKMYRESLLNLLSCGVFYHGDSSGSIWKLLPNSYRAVHPIEPNPFRIVEEQISKDTTKTTPISITRPSKSAGK